MSQLSKSISQRIEDGETDCIPVAQLRKHGAAVIIWSEGELGHCSIDDLIDYVIQKGNDFIYEANAQAGFNSDFEAA